jgi:hypothetical protein
VDVPNAGRELPAYEHITGCWKKSRKHPGRMNVRKLYGHFTIPGLHGEHLALVLQPAQISLADMHSAFFQKKGFDEGFVKRVSSSF